MAILKYLGIVFYAARAARAETERTPLVPLVSIRELHEDFSGKVEDAKCEDKPELVNSHEDILVVAGECEGYKDFVVAAEMSTAARERGAEPAFPALYDPRFVKSDDTLIREPRHAAGRGFYRMRPAAARFIDLRGAGFWGRDAVLLPRKS